LKVRRMYGHEYMLPCDHCAGALELLARAFDSLFSKQS
jgi:hypothetical protein